MTFQPFLLDDGYTDRNRNQQNEKDLDNWVKRLYSGNKAPAKGADQILSPCLGIVALYTRFLISFHLAYFMK